MRCACGPAFPIVQQGERRVGINNSESKCSAAPGFAISRRIFSVLPQDSEVVPVCSSLESLFSPCADLDVAHKSIICKWPCFARSKHPPRFSIQFVSVCSFVTQGTLYTVAPAHKVGFLSCFRLSLLWLLGRYAADTTRLLLIPCGGKIQCLKKTCLQDKEFINIFSWLFFSSQVLVCE